MNSDIELEHIVNNNKKDNLIFDWFYSFDINDRT